MPVLETPADAGLDSNWILLCHVSPALGSPTSRCCKREKRPNSYLLLEFGHPAGRPCLQRDLSVVHVLRVNGLVSHSLSPYAKG